MIILGIETSCDETALALIETKFENGFLECRVISSLVHSQAELHSAYGGVFPTLAKREHGKNLPILLDKLLEDSGLQLKKSETETIGNDNPISKNIITAKKDDKEIKQLFSIEAEITKSNPDLFESLKKAKFLKYIPTIDRLAVTAGPGLEPALWVGINFAKYLGALWSIPTIPVNHMEGHIIGSLLENDKPFGAWQRLKNLKFPALALLISGGHTELVRIESQSATNKTPEQNGPNNFSYTIIGQTRDDAVGEAFDKVARLLGLPYPGGPHVSILADQARCRGTLSPKPQGAGPVSTVKLPRPMLHSADLDFSFSGLKTAVLYATRDRLSAMGKLDDEYKESLALEFEEAVSEVLVTKLRRAIEQVGAKSLIIGGGVSANRTLRERFKKTAIDYGLDLHLPTHHISGDNALMIALAGAIHTENINGDLEIKAKGTQRLGKAK